MILRAENTRGVVDVLITAETESEAEQLNQLMADMRELGAIVEWDGRALCYELTIQPHFHSHAGDANCV